MVDPLKQFLNAHAAKRAVRSAEIAAKEIANHCDKRIAMAQSHLDVACSLLLAVKLEGAPSLQLRELIDTFLERKFDV